MGLLEDHIKSEALIADTVIAKQPLLPRFAFDGESDIEESQAVKQLF